MDVFKKEVLEKLKHIYILNFNYKDYCKEDYLFCMSYFYAWCKLVDVSKTEVSFMYFLLDMCLNLYIEKDLVRCDGRYIFNFVNIYWHNGGLNYFIKKHKHFEELTKCKD